MKRRDFLSGLAVTSASLVANQAAAQITKSTNGSPAHAKEIAYSPAGGKNIIICAANGYKYIDDGYQRLSQGADTLACA